MQFHSGSLPWELRVLRIPRRFSSNSCLWSFAWVMEVLRRSIFISSFLRFHKNVLSYRALIRKKRSYKSWNSPVRSFNLRFRAKTLYARSRKNKKVQEVYQIQEAKAMTKVETQTLWTIHLCTRRRCTSCKLLTLLSGKPLISLN